MIFRKIGIFDSGIGGLSLVKELISIPGLEFIYYADTAHVPYGNRTQEDIQKLSYAAVQFLLQHQVDAIIIACHTAATNALAFLKAQFPTIHFIDVVELIVDQTVLHSPKKIGILGTHATVASGIHKNFLVQALPDCEIIAQECPLLASAIENDWNNSHYLLELIKHYGTPLINARIDTLVLACTHYSLIQPIIAQTFGSSVKLISAEQNLQTKLEPFIDSSITKSSALQWYSSGNYRDFIVKVEMLLRPYCIEIQPQPGLDQHMS